MKILVDKMPKEAKDCPFYTPSASNRFAAFTTSATAFNAKEGYRSCRWGVCECLGPENCPHFTSYKKESSGCVRALDQLQKEYPEKEVIVETPQGTVSFRLGDALIYEGMKGELVFESE